MTDEVEDQVPFIN